MGQDFATKIIIKQCLAITLYFGTDDIFAKIWIVYFQEEEKNQERLPELVQDSV